METGVRNMVRDENSREENKDIKRNERAERRDGSCALNNEWRTQEKGIPVCYHRNKHCRLGFVCFYSKLRVVFF